MLMPSSEIVFSKRCFHTFSYIYVYVHYMKNSIPKFNLLTWHRHWKHIFGMALITVWEGAVHIQDKH